MVCCNEISQKGYNIVFNSQATLEDIRRSLKNAKDVTAIVNIGHGNEDVGMLMTTDNKSFTGGMARDWAFNDNGYFKGYQNVKIIENHVCYAGKDENKKSWKEGFPNAKVTGPKGETSAFGAMVKEFFKWAFDK